MIRDRRSCRVLRAGGGERVGEGVARGRGVAGGGGAWQGLGDVVAVELEDGGEHGQRLHIVHRSVVLKPVYNKRFFPCQTLGEKDGLLQD